MKLTAGSHSEIEGGGAQSNTLLHSASELATDEGAAGNAESVASEVLDAQQPTEHQPKVTETPSAAADAEATDQTDPNADVDTHTLTGKHQQQPRRSAVISEYNNRAFPALCRPYANVHACCTPPGVVSGKRDLINLQSNLSPKYIGFANANSPTPLSDSDDTVRSTRRRANQAAAALNSSSTGEILFQDNASPNTTREGDTLSGAGAQLHDRGGSQSYMSPIEKLLIKNGANSPNSTGFEADAEDHGSMQVRKQLKQRKMKRMTKSKAAEAIADIEEKPESQDKEGPSNEQTSNENSQIALIIKSETDAETEAVPAVQLVVSPKDSSCLQAEVDMQTSELAKAETIVSEEAKELTFALPMAASTEVDMRSPPPDLSSTASEVNSMVKSPSSVSIDSAKGMSIVTDPGWPTYQVGDLFWGKIFTYCFWPCMVCPDPLDQIVGNVQSHPQRASVDNTSMPIQVHVRFFADNGRRNWIKPENLLPFAGLKAFEEQREEVLVRHGPRSAKYRQMVPKKTKIAIWHQAIDEAQIVTQLPYAERLEKFFEIYESVVTINKQRRKRTSSMMQDTSDVGSSLYDSNDNLHNRPLMLDLKRERSESPFSPAFSPVKVKNEMRAKRRKLSDGNEAETGTSNSLAVTPLPGQVQAQAGSSTDKILTPDASIYENPEFGQLFDAVKEYVMVHRSEERVEKVLLGVVSNIWSLRYIQMRELERDIASGEMDQQLGSSVLERGRGVGTIKRLSNRLKTLMVRRSMTPVVAPSPTFTEPSAERRILEVPKMKKALNRPIDEVVQDILQLDSKYLFRGLTREPVCKYCYEPGYELQRCSSGCNSWLHTDCLERKKSGQKMPKAGGQKKDLSLQPSTSKSPSPTDSEHITADAAVYTTSNTPLVCHECESGQVEGCVICHQVEPPSNEEESQLPQAATENNLLTCGQPMCGKRFHTDCCKYWPQANTSKPSPRCPRHVCHTCVWLDPSGKFQHVGNSKLAKCVRCPATYHQDSHCIPAGTRMLTATHIICPRHSINKSDAHLNVIWCCICVKGGELLCCETCPIAVHAHCRNIPIEKSENYICEECESGRMPLYGEIVWAKFNNFRWWPAIILPPPEIPKNILKKPHGDNDFVVRFFGTHDHGWISRRRVYLYIEGDKLVGDTQRTKTLLHRYYNTGVEEATRFLQIVKERRKEQAIGRQSANKLHPPPYVRIKANKAVPPLRFTPNMEDISACGCPSDAEHPCGPDSGCINRLLFNECNPEICRAGQRCENQMFELRKTPLLEVVYMNERGFGLVCREPIAQGDFVIEYVGEVINHAEFQQRMVQKQRDRDENYYFLGVEKDFIIDAGPKGNLARFMNHSCEPNCETQKWTVNSIHRVGLFAIKDIPANTELTFNYLWADLMNNRKKSCFCGATRCSGEIGGKLKN
ncbi:hypothetical protein KR059_003790, partial [Drosophila kikkawai]